MPFCKVILALVALVCFDAASAQTRLGAQGTEGEPNRRQQWLLPSPDPKVLAHAVLYRPAGDGPFPLALIAHDSTQDAPRRAQMPQPEYRALAAWLVGRGYAVLVPERPGHGATGGPYIEDQGGCDDANYSRAGYATADSIKAAMNYLLGENFIRDNGVVIIGQGAGGWGALALAGDDPKIISAIVAFAPGRGGHADNIANKVCAPRSLITSAAEFADDSRIPVVWLEAANDSYFPPDLAKQMADSFRADGGTVEFKALPAFGSEGHALAESDGADKLFGPVLDTALKTGPVKPAAKK